MNRAPALERLALVLLLLFGFFLPILHSISELILVILLVLTLTALLLRRATIEWSELETMLLLFFAWRALSLILSPHPVEPRAWEKIIAFLAAFVTTVWFRNPSAAGRFLGGLLVGTSVAVVLGMVKYLLGLEERIAGLNVGYTTLAYFCAVSCLIVLVLFLRGGRHRWTGLALSLVPLLGLLFTFARTMWITAFAAVTLMALRFHRRLLLIPVAIGLLAVVLMPGYFAERLVSLTRPGSGHSDRDRLLVWSRAPEFFAQRPLLGHGASSFVYLFKAGDRVGWYDADISGWHNDFIQTAVEAGLPGLVLWLWIGIWTVRRAWRGIWRCDLEQRLDRLRLMASLTVLVFLGAGFANGMLNDMMAALAFFALLPLFKKDGEMG